MRALFAQKFGVESRSRGELFWGRVCRRGGIWLGEVYLGWECTVVMYHSPRGTKCLEDKGIFCGAGFEEGAGPSNQFNLE